MSKDEANPVKICTLTPFPTDPNGADLSEISGFSTDFGSWEWPVFNRLESFESGCPKKKIHPWCCVESEVFWSRKTA